MSDTPIYDATVDALLLDADPLAAREVRHVDAVPTQRPPTSAGGRHHLRARQPLPGEPALASFSDDPFHHLRKDPTMPDAPAAGDPDTLAVLVPVELIETDDEPTASPPDSWDSDAHLDALRADPDVDLVED